MDRFIRKNILQETALIILFVIFLSCLSCSTTRNPVVYDKSNDDIDRLTGLISYLIKNRSIEKAKEQLQIGFEKYPDSSELKLLNGWLYLSLGNIKESGEVFNQLYEKKKISPLLLTGMARIERIKLNYQPALELIERSLKINNLLSATVFENGLIYFDMKDYNRSILYINRAEMLDPSNNDILFFKYLNNLLIKKNIDEVKHIWAKILEKDQLKDWYFINHAYYLSQLQRFDDALLIVEQGLGFFPNNSYLLNLYLCVVMEQNKNNQQKEYLDKLYEDANKLISVDIKSLIPEFIDTFYTVCELSGRTSLISETIGKFLIEFPDSHLLAGWFNRYK